ncbi:MAG TPA: hypothetical protein PKY78_01640 [Candidatus Omnitrophota bacterium]|nr:hypothetical protein [Candidatus Omnitrophota bacterium]HPS19682.1 hypothetical protein [Candidatus Omnitrophota bacterium]
MRNLIVLMLIVVFFAVGCGKKEPRTRVESNNKTTTAIIPAETKVVQTTLFTQKETWAAVSKNKLEELLQNVNNGAVIKRMYDAREAILLKAGLKVTAVQEDGKMIQVKLDQGNILLWTMKEFLAVPVAVYTVDREGWAAPNKQNMVFLKQNLNNLETIKKMHEMQVIFMLKKGLDVRVIKQEEGFSQVEVIANGVKVWVFSDILKKK